MSVDVHNSPYAALPPGTHQSADGLTYSRHYAQRIRDMGKSSKDSWIKRLWNHMFTAKKKEEKDEQQRSRNSSQEFPPPKQYHSSTGKSSNSPRIRQRKNSPSGQVPTLPAIKSHSSTYSRDPNQELSRTNSKESSRDNSKSAPSQNARNNLGKMLAPELKQSPYLSSVQKIAFEKNKNNRGNYAKTSQNNGAYQRKATHPYLSTHQDEWRPRITRDSNTINLERRAKAVAEEGMKSSKIFTCEGPYPVDAYVRLSLRKRGWVEKFGHRANGAHMGTKEKLVCDGDEDIEAIIDQRVPAPWEEDYGLYAVTSRIVRHYPAKFIWGSRNVNNLVIRNEVIVNHFPKARAFSSKVNIVYSLKELPWLNSADSLAFFPRCYVINEEEKGDIIDDFRITACMGLLRMVLKLCVPKHKYKTEESGVQREITRYEEVVSKYMLEEEAKLNEEKEESSEPQSEVVKGEDGGEETEDKDVKEKEETDQSETGSTRNDESQNMEHSLEKQTSESAESQGIDGDDDTVDLESKDCEGEDEVDEESNESEKEEEKEQERPQKKQDLKGRGGKQQSGKKGGKGKSRQVRPEIEKKKKKIGGEVPAKALDWALAQCDRYLKFKSNDDIDNRKRGLSQAQWDQLLNWFNQLAHEDGTISVTVGKLYETEEMLKKMKEVWAQFDIDGTKNMWIIKPGDKSKGIGIEFCSKIEDIVKYATNSTTAGNYVVQKYIERPLLVYKCKFDIRQWFLVTDWNPMTVWFYKESYLRICSQEYSFDSMHESIHLSNVAVQQNYLNGERSDKLPDSNFMKYDIFKEYLSEIGHPDAWDEIVYPGMKDAIINTLLATVDVAEHRKCAFELYGADFMISDDMRPWLLEINASPGMAPGNKDKVILCKQVIEDTIKVVLDRRENRSCATGNFELIHKDAIHPPHKCVETRFLLEGSRIRKNDLPKYTELDRKNLQTEKDKERKLKQQQQKQAAQEKEANKETTAETDEPSGDQKSKEDEEADRKVSIVSPSTTSTSTASSNGGKDAVTSPRKVNSNNQGSGNGGKGNSEKNKTPRRDFKDSPYNKQNQLKKDNRSQTKGKKS